MHDPTPAQPSPAARRSSARRWRTRFGSWVRGSGVTRLTTALASRSNPLTNIAVYHWVAGRHFPQPEHLRAMLRLSRGALTLEDLYRHRDALAGGTNGRTRPAPRGSGPTDQLAGSTA